jgi:acyl dehydratase
MAVDGATITPGTEVPTFVRTTGFHNWNRFAAVNDEFVPIHMDEEAGRAAGFAGAFGMGNLLTSYLHNMLRDWIGDDGRIVSLSCSFRAPNNRGMTVEARGKVVDVREEDGVTFVDLDVAVVDHDAPDTVLAPGRATVTLAPA